MKQLFSFFLLLLFVVQSFAQSKISDEQEDLGFDFLPNSFQRPHVTNIDGSDYLFIWTFENILKINIDDPLAPVSFIEHKSNCSTASEFFDDKIISSNRSDIYEIDLATGEHLFHLNIETPNTYYVAKVGKHYYIRGFQFDKLYNTDLNQLIDLPHSRHYYIIGDKLLAVGNEPAFKEYGALFHIDLDDGSQIIDYDDHNIKQHTLFRRDENVEKVFFMTTDQKLYSIDRADFTVSLLCSNFNFLNYDLHYRNDKLYVSELNGAALKVFEYDFENCQLGTTIGDITNVGYEEEITDLYTLQNGTTHAVSTGYDVFVLDKSMGMTQSVRVNNGWLSGFSIIENQFFTTSTTEDGNLNINVNAANGDLVFSDQVPGEGIYSYTKEDELVTLFVNDDDLFQLVLKSDFTYTVVEIAVDGINEGPYEESEWFYRSGYFYSMISNNFHYKNQSEWIQKIDDIKWNGIPWINADGNLVGISTTDSNSEVIIYDLENEIILNTFQVNLPIELRSIIEIGGNYFIVSLDNIFSLDISNGTVIELMHQNFIPYLTSANRSVGRMYNPTTDNFSFVSFDGTQFIELQESAGELILIRPINQFQGSYMLFGLSSLTTFNILTDELVSIPQEGAYFFTPELKYNGENCFAGFGNVYYYSQDTLVQKQLLIEEEDDLDLGYSYVANNTIFASISTFDNFSGLPFAQTTDDEVIALESRLGSVSISDAIFVDNTYYILSFDELGIYLHSLSSDFGQSEELKSFPRPTCHFHKSFYFIGPDYEGDINFRIADRDKGIVYYQYQHDEQDVSLLFNPSDEIGQDIGDLKFYDDKGFYFAAKDEGYNYQMWTIANEQDPNAVKEIKRKKNVSLVYPNPFNNSISFKKDVRDVSIFDMMGRKVYQSEVNKDVMNIDALDVLTGGLYLVEYTDTDEKIKVVERVVKM